MRKTIASDIKEMVSTLDFAGKSTAQISIHTSESTVKKAGGIKGEDGSFYVGLHRINILPSLRPGKKKSESAAAK